MNDPKIFVTVELQYEEHLREMSDWCYSNIGKWVNDETSSWTWSGDIAPGGQGIRFKFRHEKDAMFFALRWKQ